MLIKMYCVRDVKVVSFRAPMYAHNIGHCLRFWSDLLARSDDVVGHHPDDFELYEVGHFDDEKGVVVGLAQPKYICRLSDLENVKVEDKHVGRA